MLDTRVSSTKTAELIETPFGEPSRVSPKNIVLDGATDHSWERARSRETCTAYGKYPGQSESETESS